MVVILHEVHKLFIREVIMEIEAVLIEGEMVGRLLRRLSRLMIELIIIASL